MLSKRIALESNLPIIIVANDYPANKLTSFFKHFTTPVVVMFDEIEKNSYWWETKDLLGFLDGVEATSKKLVLMTCNKTDEIDDNFFDRCSRVRYFKEYEANSNSVFVRYMAEDKGVKNIDEVEWDTSGNFITDTNTIGEDFIVDSNIFEETKTAA